MIESRPATTTIVGGIVGGIGVRIDVGAELAPRARLNVQSQPPQNPPGVVQRVLALGRAFHLLFVAGVLGDLGGFATQTALTLHIYKLTHHDSTYLGLMAIATLLPMILAAPIGGVWAEKGNRTRILTIAVIARVPIVLLMIPASGSVPALLLLQSALCASVAVAMPARQSLIPELVPESGVQLANALLGGVVSVIHVLGPTVGAYLYVRFDSLLLVLIFEATLYLAAATCIRIGVREPKRAPQSGPQPSMMSEISDGLNYVLREPDLRQIFMMLVAIGLALGLVVPLLRPFTDEVLHGDDTTYARMMAAFGFGGFIGPFIGYALGRTIGLGWALTLCFGIDALLVLLFARTSTSWLSHGLLFLWGVEVFALIPCYMSYVHVYAQKKFMARTFALFDQSMYVPQIMSAVLVTAIARRVTAQTLLTIAGLTYVVLLALMSLTAGARLLRSRRGQPPAERYAQAEAQAAPAKTEDP